jgi:putative membrane protein
MSRGSWRGIAGAAVVLVPGLALGHAVEGAEDHRSRWWWAWSWQPGPMVGLVVVTAIYTLGLGRRWREAGRWRGVARWQVWCFAGGVASLALALLSPIGTLAGQLNWVHMIQHTLLMLVAAPLLVAGSPGVVALWAVSGRWGRARARLVKRMRLRKVSRYMLWQPLVVWGVFAGVLWVWHVPGLYTAALRNQLVHDVQHLAFVVAACLYWRLVLDPLGRVRLTPMLAVVYLFTMSLHGMLLGVFMVLAPGVWYEDYAATAPAWGVTALEDQQIAGWIMWMPACAIYAFIAAVIFGRWLHRSSRHEALTTVPEARAGT